jgi:hypothetical protein
MPIEPAQPIQLHVHLPEGTSDEPRLEHVHLYLHVAGTAESGAATARDRPLRKAAGLILLVGLSAFGTAWASHHLARTRAEPDRQQQAATPEPALPPALAQQLARPGRLTPPPGHDPAGPSAFGLNP